MSYSRVAFPDPCACAPTSAPPGEACLAGPSRLEFPRPLLGTPVFWLARLLPTRERDAFRQVLLFKLAADGIVPGVSYIGQAVGHPKGEENCGVTYRARRRGLPFSTLFKVIRVIEARSARIATGMHRRQASQISCPSLRRARVTGMGVRKGRWLNFSHSFQRIRSSGFESEGLCGAVGWMLFEESSRQRQKLSTSTRRRSSTH